MARLDVSGRASTSVRASRALLPAMLALVVA
jgi:hypothetical protein